MERNNALVGTVFRCNTSRSNIFIPKRSTFATMGTLESTGNLPRNSRGWTCHYTTINGLSPRHGDRKFRSSNERCSMPACPRTCRSSPLMSRHRRDWDIASRSPPLMSVTVKSDHMVGSSYFRLGRSLFQPTLLPCWPGLWSHSRPKPRQWHFDRAARLAMTWCHSLASRPQRLPETLGIRLRGTLIR